MNDFLSVGSVVRLKKKNTVRISIVGYYPINNNNRYDYLGVVIPFGYMPEASMILFNHEEIEDIEFLGYKDKDFTVFEKVLMSVKSENI